MQCAYVCLCFFVYLRRRRSRTQWRQVVGTMMRGLFWGLCACDVEGVAGGSGGGVEGDGAARGVDAGANV